MKYNCLYQMDKYCNSNDSSEHIQLLSEYSIKLGRVAMTH